MTTNEFVLALDQGTTSSRAIVFDRDGVVRGIGQREFRQHYPRPGWVEHDPGEIWHSQLDVAREALRNAAAGLWPLAAAGARLGRLASGRRRPSLPSHEQCS